MKIRMLMTVMALTIMVGARAGQVGEKQARQKASAFMTGQATTRGEVSMTRVYLPLQTKSTIWSVTDAPIYVFKVMTVRQISWASAIQGISMLTVCLSI